MAYFDSILAYECLFGPFQDRPHINGLFWLYFGTWMLISALSGQAPYKWPILTIFWHMNAYLGPLGQAPYTWPIFTLLKMHLIKFYFWPFRSRHHTNFIICSFKSRQHIHDIFEPFWRKHPMNCYFSSLELLFIIKLMFGYQGVRGFSTYGLVCCDSAV